MEYSHLKLLHIVAVIIFLGNIFTGLFWMHIAVKTRDIKIIAHTMKGVIKSDRIFTGPGVVFITTFGFIAAIYGRLPLLGTGWILWSIILFSISGLSFAIRIAPLQKKILEMALRQEDSNDFNWVDFKTLYLKWELWGAFALITPLGALVMMTLKIPA